MKIAVPVLAFLATYGVGIWLRQVVDNLFRQWMTRTKWEGIPIITKIVHRTFLFWFLLMGSTIAVQVSVLAPGIKSITGKLFGSLFIVSLGWVATTMSEQLLRFHLSKVRAPSRTITFVVNVVRITVIAISVLAILDIWGMPTSPLLLLIGIAVLAGALAFRDAVPNLVAGLQLNAVQQIKVGDYIKMETGEEGYVTEISWNNTYIKTLDEKIVIIPNSRLLRDTVINYGRPLKKAEEPFRFYTRVHLTELTGLKAKNLAELVDILKSVPDGVIYYHTHSFLEQHNYLVPEPANDFAVWVTDALGDEVLGERLASIDTFAFANLEALRDRLVGIIEEYLRTGYNSRDVMPGREFHFMKSVSVILPTPYVAHDLREFAQILHKISLSSIYLHVFESRLRLGKGLNDFSMWIQDKLGEVELAERIARLDPYTYTLEGLRSTLAQLIEKRIK